MITWYALKYKGRYVRSVERQDGKTRIATTEDIRDSKLMNDEMRKNWIMSMIICLKDFEADKLESIKVDVEATIVDDSETDEYGIRFESGEYLVNTSPEGIATTKTSMTEEECLCYADLFSKEGAKAIAEVLKALSDSDTMEEPMGKTFTAVPIKRTYSNIISL